MTVSVQVRSPSRSGSSVEKGVGRRARPSYRLLLAAVLVLLGTLAGSAWTLFASVMPTASPADAMVAIAPNPALRGSVAWKLSHGQRVNVLLLSYGGPGHNGAYLTDSMVLVSLRAGRAALISIPRDLVARIPAFPDGGYVTERINNAYAIGSDRRDYPSVSTRWTGPTGGGDLAAAAISEISGQKIDGWISLDFAAFRGIVDALGGVRLDVLSTIDDPRFPLGETDAYMHVHFSPGLQWMDGTRALEYARSRESTSDFDRSARQRQLIVAIRERMRSVQLWPRLPRLLVALYGNLRTNLRPADLLALLRKVSHLQTGDVRSLGISDQNLLYREPTSDGNYVLFPRDRTFAQVGRFVASAIP